MTLGIDLTRAVKEWRKDNQMEPRTETEQIQGTGGLDSKLQKPLPLFFLPEA